MCLKILGAVYPIKSPSMGIAYGLVSQFHIVVLKTCDDRVGLRNLLNLGRDFRKIVVEPCPAVIIMDVYKMTLHLLELGVQTLDPLSDVVIHVHIRFLPLFQEVQQPNLIVTSLVSQNHVTVVRRFYLVFETKCIIIWSLSNSNLALRLSICSFFHTHFSARRKLCHKVGLSLNPTLPCLN
jgi:hypothetical protein